MLVLFDKIGNLVTVLLLGLFVEVDRLLLGVSACGYNSDTSSNKNNSHHYFKITVGLLLMYNKIKLFTNRNIYF